MLTRFIKATAEGNRLALTDRGARQGGAGREGQHPRSENPRHQLRGFQGAVAAGHRADAGGGENILKQFPDASRNLADYIDTSILDGLKK